jgi:hypothetical protein
MSTSFTFPSPSRRGVVQARRRHSCPGRHEGHGYRVFPRVLLHVLPSDSVEVVERHVPLTIFQLSSLFDCCHRNLLSVNRFSDTSGLRWSCRALDQFDAPRLTASMLGGAKRRPLHAVVRRQSVNDTCRWRRSVPSDHHHAEQPQRNAWRHRMDRNKSPSSARRGSPRLKAKIRHRLRSENPDRMTGPSSRPAPRYRSSTCR